MVQPGVDDVELVRRLRVRDGAAFAAIVDAWSSSMLRLARSFVTTDASAEEVLQDTWIAVIGGLDSFAGRSSLRTWAYRILVNTAKRRGRRESRTVPFADWGTSDEEAEPGPWGGRTVDPARFRGSGEEYPGHWREWPGQWPASPERELLAAEIRSAVAAALEQIPDRQRIVLLLRDVEGYPSDEVCEILEISAANQRVLLHRGRAAVRGILEEYFSGQVF